MKRIVYTVPLFCTAFFVLSSCGKKAPAGNPEAADTAKVLTSVVAGKWLVDYAEGEMAKTYESMLFVFDDEQLTTYSGAVTTPGAYTIQADTLEWKVQNNAKNLVKYHFRVQGDTLVLKRAKTEDVVYLKKQL